MKIKRFLAAALLCAVLTACSSLGAGGVTAESLIDGAAAAAGSEGTVSGQVIFEMKLSADKELGDYGRFETLMKGRFDIKGDNDTCYISNDLMIDFMGSSDTRHSEQWSTKKDGMTVSYTLDEKANAWQKTTSRTGSSDAGVDASLMSAFLVLKSSDFAELKMTSSDKGYLVSGITDGSKLDKAMGGLADITDGVGGMNGPVSVTMCFDRMTRECTAVTYDLTDSVKSTSRLNVESFVLGVQIYSRDGKKLKVPDEVIRSAEGSKQ